MELGRHILVLKSCSMLQTGLVSIGGRVSGEGELGEVVVDQLGNVVGSDARKDSSEMIPKTFSDLGTQTSSFLQVHQCQIVETCGKRWTVVVC